MITLTELRAGGILGVATSCLSLPRREEVVE